MNDQSRIGNGFLGFSPTINRNQAAGHDKTAFDLFNGDLAMQDVNLKALNLW